MINLAKLALK